MIKLAKFGKKQSRKVQAISTSEGFSLIEATVALTTLGICLAYAMPLFLYSKMNNIKSEVRTGALMVSQQIFDDIRGLPFESIPTAPVNSPTIIQLSGTEVSLATGSTIPKNEYKIMNRLYKAKVFYCETPADCDTNYKTFRVEVKDKNDHTVYEMEAGFTNFK